eukprot:762751-Pleurochrysis_carterae.AAC.2
MLAQLCLQRSTRRLIALARAFDVKWLASLQAALCRMPRKLGFAVKENQRNGQPVIGNGNKGHGPC